MGVSLKKTFCVKYILQKTLWETAEIAGIYAGFSPVLPDSVGKFHQRLVVPRCVDNNI